MGFRTISTDRLVDGDKLDAIQTSGDGSLFLDNGGTYRLVNKSDAGLGNVDNTSDADKPISMLTQTALDGKVDKVVGKGLSTEDYTAAEKTKLAGITGTNTGDQNIFSIIAVSGQSNVVPDSSSDTLTFVAGANMSITTDADTDTITFASTGGGSGGGDVSQSSNSGSSGRMKVSAGADKTITDYSGGAGIVKSDANGVVSQASDGTDYLSPSTVQTEVSKNGHLRNLMSTALLTSATMTVNADPTKFDIPAFTAQFVDNYTDPSNPTLTVYNYPGSTANAVTNLATWESTYISVDKNGTVYQTQTIINEDLIRDRVAIGTLAHTSHTQIDSVDAFTNTNGWDVAASLYDISDAIGIINKGNKFSGNPTSTLKLNKSSGKSIQIGVNFKNSKKNPNVTTDSPLTAPVFYSSWRDGSGGFNVVLTDTITPGKYDDGTGGASSPNGTVTTNQWTLKKLYWSPDLQAVAVEYGQAKYNSEALAEAAKSSETVVNPALVGFSFRGWLVCRGGATNLTLSSDAVFLDAGKFGSLTSGAASGASTTTLQGAYDNSTQPQITTDSTRGALQAKRGSASDTDKVFQVLNGAGTETFGVTGEGNVNGNTGTFTGGVTALKSATTTVDVSSATAPSAGQVLTATSSTAATWQTVSGGFQSEPLQDYQGQNFIGTLGAFAFDSARTIDEVTLTVDSIPVGANATLELRKNSYSSGSILSSALTVATSDTLTNGKKTVSTTSFTSASVADGDYLVAYLTAVGTTTPISNAVVNIRFH